MKWCSATPGGVRLALQITPGARKTEVIGVHDDALKLKLQAQPIEGKANEALIRFVADTLGVRKSAVAITHGQTNRRKLLEVSVPGLAVETVERAFCALVKTQA